MDRHFDEELNDLRQKLLKMAAIAEDMIALSIKALKERKEELTKQIFQNEETINNMQIEIDETCLKLIALRQPAAVDLRFITSAMKINSDLERIGDQAVNIAQRALELLKSPPLKPLIDIPRMAELSQKMVMDSINALVNKDEKLARDVCKRDSQVDELNDQVFRELLTYMMQDSKNIERAVDLILVGRHLERIADHATNISEDVVYLVSGKTIMHHFEEKSK